MIRLAGRFPCAHIRARSPAPESFIIGRQTASKLHARTQHFDGAPSLLLFLALADSPLRLGSIEDPGESRVIGCCRGNRARIRVAKSNPFDLLRKKSAGAGQIPGLRDRALGLCCGRQRRHCTKLLNIYEHFTLHNDPQ